MSQTLRVYKFLVVPVCQQVDDAGVVTGEVQPREPDHVFGLDGLRRYVEGFEEALEAHVASMTNGAPPAAVTAQLREEVSDARN